MFLDTVDHGSASSKSACPVARAAMTCERVTALIRDNLSGELAPLLP
jgi:hypothetical protein